MHHYRQALLLLRQGDSNRQIAATKLMGGAVATLRVFALLLDWLNAGTLMPGIESIACALKPAKKASTIASSLEPHCTRMEAWFFQGMNGVVTEAVTRLFRRFTQNFNQAVMIKLYGWLFSKSP